MSAMDADHDVKRSSTTALPYINVTPLIDVLLVLLIIFMVITPLKPARFEAAVPQEPPPEREVQIKPNPLTLVVSIDSTGALRLNEKEELGTVEAPGPLGARLRDVFEERKRTRAYKEGIELSPNFAQMSEDERIEKRVFIKAPRSTKYEQVVQVIDTVKGAGASPIGLQIDDLAQ